MSDFRAEANFGYQPEHRITWPVAILIIFVALFIAFIAVLLDIDREECTSSSSVRQVPASSDFDDPVPADSYFT